MSQRQGELEAQLLRYDCCRTTAVNCFRGCAAGAGLLLKNNCTAHECVLLLL